MIEYCGVKFRNPFVVASSPLTVKPFLMKQAWDNGAAAASTKMTLIKQRFYKKLRMYHDVKNGSIICADRRLDIEEGIRLIEESKKAAPDLVLFANITHEGADLESWGVLAKAMEDAGADLIEANFICPNLALTARALGEGVESGGALVGQSPQLAYDVVRVLKESVKIPVVPKLTPNVTDLAMVAVACQRAGADGLSMAGAQLSLPPVDLDNLNHVYDLTEGASFGSLGGPACQLPGYYMVASTAKRVDIPICGGGGLMNWQHAVQYMLYGSTLVTACTSLMWYGFEIIPGILNGMERYMKKNGWTRWEDMVGKAVHNVRAASDLELIDDIPHVDASKCNGCQQCLRPGHCYAITMQGGLPYIDREKCLGCSACVAVCSKGALYFPVYDRVSGQVLSRPVLTKEATLAD